MYYSDFLPVIPFLCGPFNEEGEDIMRNYKITVSPSIRASLETWILQIIHDINDHTSSSNVSLDLFILQCLYELHDDQFVQKAMESWGFIHMYGYFIGDMTCWILRYCIHCCHGIKGLDISLKTTGQLRMLMPSLPNCGKLRLVW